MLHLKMTHLMSMGARVSQEFIQGDCWLTTRGTLRMNSRQEGAY